MPADFPLSHPRSFSSMWRSVKNLEAPRRRRPRPYDRPQTAASRARATSMVEARWGRSAAGRGNKLHSRGEDRIERESGRGGEREGARAEGRKRRSERASERARCQLVVVRKDYFRKRLPTPSNKPG